MATCAYGKHHSWDGLWIVFAKSGTDGWNGWWSSGGMGGGMPNVPGTAFGGATDPSAIQARWMGCALFLRFKFLNDTTVMCFLHRRASFKD